MGERNTEQGWSRGWSRDASGSLRHWDDPAGTSDSSREAWSPAHQIPPKVLLPRGKKDAQSPAVPPSARALTVLAVGPGHAGWAAAGARAGLAGAPVLAAAGLAAAPPEGAGRAGWGRMAEVSGDVVLLPHRRSSTARGCGLAGREQAQLFVAAGVFAFLGLKS